MMSRSRLFGLLSSCLLLLFTSASLPAEPAYTTIAVDELKGIPRKGWPVHVGVPVYDHKPGDHLQLVRVRDEGESLEQIPFQVVSVISPSIRIDMTNRRPMWMVDLVFLADIEANEQARFRLYYHGEPSGTPSQASPTPQLSVEPGDLLARIVDTGTAKFGFHDLSGQLLDYTWTPSGERIHFTIPGRKRPIHHNPDAWTLPARWSHASGWRINEADRAPRVLESSGPLMWRTVRSGPLPEEAEIETTVTYTIYAGLPYLRQSSSMRFHANLIANAVRNNELVFSRGFMTHGVYIDHQGEVHTLRMFNPEDPEESFRHVTELTLPPDLPFIGLYHEERGDGMGIVTIDRFAYNPDGLENAGAEGAHYYFNDGNIHRDRLRNFTYFTRAEVFNRPWGESWTSTIIPSGSIFAENSVFLVFPIELNEDGQPSFASLQDWVRQLRNPPRVWVQQGIDWRRQVRR